MPLKRHAIHCATIALIMMALVGLAVWRSTHPKPDSAEARLKRIHSLLCNPPPAGPSFQEPIRTLRWYLAGHPTMEEWMLALDRHEQHLLNQGYLVNRHVVFSQGSVNAALEQRLLAAAKEAGIDRHYLASLRLSDSQLDLVVSTSDVPALEDILRTLGGTTAQTNP